MSIQTEITERDGSEAIGRTETRMDTIHADRVAAMAATLDLTDPPAHGASLPPGWQWLFFNPFVRQSELGADGHPRRGGFLPDVGLPRRMWAGGKLTYHAPLAVGAEAQKHSEIVSVKSKSGRAGQLVFVTVRHRISSAGVLCIEEDQDIVYREAPAPNAPAPTPASAPEGAAWSKPVQTDPVMLFRYSALTSNGHRIHYDQPYAKAEECYPSLVVHGPLTATLLQGFAAECRPQQLLRQFSFRGMAPLFVGGEIQLQAVPGDSPDLLTLWARGPNGELAMQAEAVFGA